MDKKRKGRKRQKRKKAEVRERLSESPTGKTVELFIACEETKRPMAIPTCLGPHKVRRLTVE